MKRVFHHPEAAPAGKRYWRSLSELAGTEEFKEKLEREFPQGAAEFNGGEVSRRHFLKIMGASTALAGIGLQGCRRPEKHLVPFNRSVEWAIPGKALFYATSMPDRNGAIPLIVTTYDGRPTKVEGNPLHPASGGHGGTDAYSQASVLDLYDPDRSRVFKHRGVAAPDEKEFVAFLDQFIAGLGSGEGVAFLLEENNSPTRARLRAEIERKYPQIRWCVYEPLASELNENAAVAYGRGVTVRNDVSGADVILALDDDFLGCEGSTEQMRKFAARRRVVNPGDKMNRLYVVENRYTITGGMADHRLRCPASQIGSFALALAERLGALSGDANLIKFAGTFPKPQVAAKFTDGWIDGVAQDLAQAKGRSIVTVGGRQPAAVQLLVQAINSALGNLGRTVLGIESPTQAGVSIAELAREIGDKRVTRLIVIGGNPAYNAPADLEWERIQGGLQEVIRLGMYEDETSALATWQVPAAHYLEAWGDGLSSDGTYVSIQPMILPLYGGWSELDLLARFAGLPKPEGPELVKETFRRLAKTGEFDAAWNKFLHDGFLAGSNTNQRTLFFMGTAASMHLGEKGLDLPVIAGADAYEVVFAADSKVGDGRHNNNGWLQETPDPVTKITWDNAALVSPATAAALGLRSEATIGAVERDVIEISLGENRTIEIPALVAPGHADHSITLHLGYGRRVVGRVGQGTGVNVYPLRTSTQPYFSVGAKVRRTGKTYKLAITQDHHSMEGRALVREGTLEHFAGNPDFARRMGMDAHQPVQNPSLYSHPPLDNVHQWGMAIDLNTCVGCTSCIVACQAENNIPIVGKDQVINGRAMHWIRMDRYFASAGRDDADPEMLAQPMLCQHCENAPCETVCPVNATVHSDDGLNVMTYNRCIGTRYCANNCPFKVRRFNFFDYNQRPIERMEKGPLEAQGLYFGPLTKKGSEESLKLQRNPNVTVRMRGVMEKCTFCVQRIQEARIAAKVHAGGSDKVRIPTDAFQVACQQACPTESIVFGDIADPGSKVSKLKKQELNYRLLEYLNVNTRISYLARLRNPNPAMTDAQKVGTLQQESGGHDQPAHGPTGASHTGDHS
jgi:MoCo/4Fe-4S cofactor protein with predicted Tat translocation signal